MEFDCVKELAQYLNGLYGMDSPSYLQDWSPDLVLEDPSGWMSHHDMHTIWLWNHHNYVLIEFKGATRMLSLL